MGVRALRALAVAIVIAGCSESTGPLGPVASIELASVADVWVGDVVTLQATPRTAGGAPLADRQLSWTSSNSPVASVDMSGHLTALAVGTTTITVTCEGKSAELAVAVSDMDLIYQGFLEGVSEMLLLSLKGGAPTRVLPAGAIVAGPVPSPDGSRIAFVASEVQSPGGDIYIVNRDGTGLYRLTTSPELDDNPSWSPDGTKIAFRSYRTQRKGDIWVVNVDGTNAVNLTPDDTTDERKPAWSPDGTRIAFSSNRSSNFDIWTMRSDGTELLQLTSTLQYDTEPTWSPDGSRIAFRRSDDFNSDVLVINARGGTPTRLVIPGHELMPSWSPNGTLIAFAYFAPGERDPQIYTMTPNGTDLTLRTTEPSWNGGIEPAWIRR